jgi:hypothetical protein
MSAYTTVKPPELLQKSLNRTNLIGAVTESAKFHDLTTLVSAGGKRLNWEKQMRFGSSFQPSRPDLTEGKKAKPSPGTQERVRGLFRRLFIS